MNSTGAMNSSPFLDSGMEGWTKMFIQKNLWRVEDRYEFDDLISEAWLVLDKVSKRYIDVSEKHLMALYKRSFSNRLHDLATESSRSRFVEFGFNSTDEFPDPADLTPAPRSVCDSKMLSLVIESGELISSAYEVVLTGKLKDIPGERESHNQIFDRVLQRPEGTKSALKFRDFLRSQAQIPVQSSMLE